jgi:predicted enzyme related to lactoylglutathione lyase
MAKGFIAHIEFPADDPQRAMRFYSAVAGWEFGELEGMEGYHLFRSGDGQGGAIGLRGQTIAAALRLYINVDTLEEAVAAAEASGGTVLEPPTGIGGGFGRFAVVRDPEGTEVGLWEAPEAAPGAPEA